MTRPGGLRLGLALLMVLSLGILALFLPSTGNRWKCPACSYEWA